MKQELKYACLVWVIKNAWLGGSARIARPTTNISCGRRLAQEDAVKVACRIRSAIVCRGSHLHVPGEKRGIGLVVVQLEGLLACHCFIG